MSAIRNHFRKLHIGALIGALTLIGCTPADTPVANENILRTGPWHATLELPGGAAPFGMEIASREGKLVVSIINGSERIDVPRVSLTDDRFSLVFPAYNNRLDARLIDGKLQGSLTLVKRYGKTQIIAFRAAPGAREQEAQPTKPSVDLSGRWEVEFLDQDGERYPAVGEFQQRGNRLLGTFLTEKGDYRYLGGNVIGNALTLSTFDGAHAFLFTARATQSGELSGQFWSGNAWQETWVAKRNQKAALRDASALTFLKPGFERFTFAFNDLDGNRISLDDEEFKGRVVMVTLAGSWCPNCHDEAAFMKELYARYKDRGLSVIALMYEHLEDEEAAKQQVRLFREKFDIQYHTLLAGISDKTEAAKTLPALNHVLAFPTTIMIGRQGKVRDIHTGFSGPGTGEHYEALRTRYNTLLTTLLAESPSIETATTE